MAVKPPQIRYVTPGKSLGASIHKGWAATWNWVLSWVHHFTPGKGLKLSGASSGHPKLDVLIEGGPGVDVTCAGDRNAYVIGLTGETPASGGGDVVFTGTDTSQTDAGDDFTFAAASNSNVEVTCSGSTITIGVYYV